MIKLCIFDLDGTLLDTVESIRFNLNEVLTAYGIRNISTAETKVFVGDGARMLVVRSLRAAGKETESDLGAALADEITAKYNALYDSRPFYLTEPYPGIIEAVAELRARGVKLAVLSNKPDPTTQQLIRKYFADSFDIVLGAGKFPRKPDPTSALFICESLSVKPEEVAYFGDTSTDMKTAKSFGAGKTVGVSWGFRDRAELVENGADTVLDNGLDIPSVIT